MNRGCLIFAHDGEVDYGSQAVLASKLVKKHLGVPVCLVTDKDTLISIGDKFRDMPFDDLIIIEKPITKNTRRLARPDGTHETVSFINSNRTSAYDLTPYDRTLVIDTDFLVFSNELGNYWDSQYDFLIIPGMKELQEELIIPGDHKVSETTVSLMWATNIMFSKTPETKLLFELVDYIREDYDYYSYLYEFLNHQYRNDYAFSIACHIMSGYGTDTWHGKLPMPLHFIDSDEIIKVTDQGQINFLVPTKKGPIMTRCQGQDVHIMNKRSILKNLDKLLELT